MNVYKHLYGYTTSPRGQNTHGCCSHTSPPDSRKVKLLKSKTGFKGTLSKTHCLIVTWLYVMRACLSFSYRNKQNWGLRKVIYNATQEFSIKFLQLGIIWNN